MADTNGLLTWSLFGGGLFVLGRWSNSLATDVARSELASKAGYLDEIAGRTEPYIEPVERRTELRALRGEIGRFKENQAPHVKRAARKLSESAGEAGGKVRGWARKVYSKVPFVGGKKKTKETKPDPSPDKGSEVGAHEPTGGVKARVSEDGDEVVIRMSKGEWDQIQAEEAAMADDPAVSSED